jgi:hypothetical protein
MAEGLARHGATVALSGRMRATLKENVAAIGERANVQTADVPTKVGNDPRQAIAPAMARLLPHLVLESLQIAGLRPTLARICIVQTKRSCGCTHPRRKPGIHAS